MSKKCIFCGADMDDDDLYCGDCGKKQEADGSAPAPKKKKKGKRRLLKAAVIVAAALFLLSMLGSHSSPSPKDAETVSPAVSAQGEGLETDGQAVPAQETDPQADMEADSRASEEELLALIDQTEEILSKTYEELSNVLGSDYYEGKWRDCLTLFKQMDSDLSALRTRAEAVSGLDKTLKNARDEYFNMSIDAGRSISEVWTFMVDYFDLGEAALFYRPKAEDFASAEEYCTALDAWYKEVKEGYTAITSCPSCMDSQWKAYGDTLELNSSICQKLYFAEQYNDPLRRQSAINMSNRYDTVEDLQYNKFIESLDGEVTHARRQRDMAAGLAEEMHSYAALEEEERDGYEFENIRTGRILLKYDAIDTIYPSLYDTYDAFVVVKTGCISGTRSILIEAEIPGFTQTYKESFNLNSAYKAIYIKPPVLTGDLNLSASKDAQIKVTVSEKDGTLIEAKTFPVTIKSRNDFEWYSDEYGLATKDNILCFLKPEAVTVSQLKRQAIDEISNMTGGNMESFVGYQNTRWDNHYVGTYIQTAGIMRALYESGVRYNMDPFSLSGSNQHILFPDEVLQQKSGLCIETSLVVASALQSANMHAFLIFPPGHAQVAVEVWNGSGNNTDGTGQYFLIETTALSSDSNNREIFIENANDLINNNRIPNTSCITYKTTDQWADYIGQENTYIVDCNDYRVLGLTPFTN